jgi:dipeptidyl aminopeptidase/acylaminoacyl peptidase
MNDATALIPRAALFGNPERSNAQISPDGAHLSWLAPLEGVMNVFVAARGLAAQARPVTFETGRGIRAYQWAHDSHHILALKDKDGDENWHVHAIDIDTAIMRDLTPHEGVQANIDRLSRKHPGSVLVTHNRRDPQFPDLYRIEIATGAETLVAKNPGLAGFVSDDDFTPRLAGRIDVDGRSMTLRPDGADGWVEWLRLDPQDAITSHPTDDFSPDGRATLMYDSRGRDTAALVRLDLETGETTVLAADDQADIGGLLTDPVTHEPLAYAVNYDRMRYHALSPRIAPDLEFLQDAGLGDWSVNARTDDDRFWVIGAASDTAPGAAYLYDRQGRTIEKLYDSRPSLADAPLAAMHPRIIAARDGLKLVSYLTLPEGAVEPVPLVLFVHGGPWARDEFGYHPYHQWLANRGYAVLSVNFRSSTGFGKSFLNAGDHEWGARMDDDLLDAVDWAVGEGIADPARIAIMGGSYGGYAVLAGMTRNPQRYACGVDIVGPSDLETLLATVPPYWESFRTVLVKALGDPETEQGRALLRERSPVHRADALARPLLIAQGANDPRVKQAESDQMVGALKAKGVPVTYVLFPDEGHGFARPENSIAFIAIAEQFLARHLGGRAEPMRAEELSQSTARLIEGQDMLSELAA